MLIGRQNFYVILLKDLFWDYSHIDSAVPLPLPPSPSPTGLISSAFT